MRGNGLLVDLESRRVIIYTNVPAKSKQKISAARAVRVLRNHESVI